MAASIRKVRITSYMKNVGRSVGTIVIDATKDYNPTIASILKGSSDTIREAKDAIRNIGNTETFGQIKETITSGAGNLMDDLKTGNIARERSEFDDMFAEMDNMDFDSSDDYEDWGDEDSTQSSSGSAADQSAAVSSVMKSTMIAHKDNVNMTNAISSATAKSAKHIAQTTLLTSQAMYELTQKGFQQTISSITNLNTTVVNLSKLAEPINIHIQNSSVFFSEMKQIMPDIQQTLHKIEENTRPISAQKKSTNNRGPRGYSDIFDSSGNFNFDAYREMVKGKGKDTLGLYLGLGQMMLGMSGGKNTSIAKAGTTKIVDMLIPTIAKESMKAFNESLASAISSTMIRGKKYAKGKGGILGELLNILTPEISGGSAKLATNRYEKGPVAWDGKSRKALMEVIPAMLGNIYTAISGQEAPVYDYESGKFTRRAAVQKKQAQDYYNAAMNAGGDFRKDLMAFVNNMDNTKYNEDYKKKLKKEMESYFLKAMESDDMDPVKALEVFGDAATSFGLGEDSWKIMRAMLDKYARSSKLKRKDGSYVSRTFDRYQSALYGAKTAHDNKMNELSNAGDSVLNMLNNNSVFGVDEYNKNQTFYLQSIYENVAFIAMNVPYIRGKSKRLKVNKNMLSTQKNRVDAISEAQKGDKEGSVEYKASDFLGSSDSERKYFGLSEEEKKALQEKEKRDKEVKENLESLGKIFKDKGEEANKKVSEIKFGQKVKNKLTTIKSWYEAPFAAMSNFIDNMTYRLNDFIFGSHGGKGLLDIMGDGIKGFFDKITTTNENGKKKLNLFGGKTLRQSMVDTWDNIKTWFSNKGWQGFFGKKGKKKYDAAAKAEEEFAAANAEYANILNALETFKGTKARGQRVTRSGLVSVSEGELIIPSEFNPYYHGSNNKSRQLAREIENFNKFYGFYAGGGNVGRKKKKKINKAGAGETEEIKDSKLNDVIHLFTMLKGKNGFVDHIGMDSGKDGSAIFYQFENRNGEWKKVQIKADQVMNYLKGVDLERKLSAAGKKVESSKKKLGKAKADFTDAMKGKGDIDGIIPFLGNSVGTLMDGFQKTFSSIFGNGDKEIEKEKSKISEVASKALESLGESKGAAAIGAIGGAGLSLLTGIMNPLAGAAIGGAIGITIKSKAVQDALFGVDEKGERDYEKGIFGEKIGKFMEKQLPDIAIGASLGGGAGLIMGSPVLGAVVGSAIGFAKSSDGIKNALFGTMKYDKDGNPIGRDNTGLISPEAQEKIKGNLGAIGAGGILGAALLGSSPIGLVGAVALGAGGGLVATSDKFKKWMFGDGEKDKGFTGMLRDKVFKNIEDIGLNIMSAIKGHGKRLFNAITRKATLTIQKIGTFITNRFFKDPNSATGRLGRGIVNIAKKPFKAVGAALEGAKNFTRNQNLKHGFDVYENGKKLNAAERLELNERIGGKKAENYANSKYGALDKALAGMNKDEVETVRDALEAMKNPKAMTKYAHGQVGRTVAKLKIKGGDKKKLQNLIISGQFEEAKKYAAEIDPENNFGVLKSVEDAIKVRSDSLDRNDGLEKLKSSMKEKYGIDFNGNKGEIISAIDRTKSELGRFDKDEATQQAENNENIAEIREIIQSISTEGIPVWLNKNKKKKVTGGDSDELQEGQIVPVTDKNGKVHYYPMVLNKNGKLVKGKEIKYADVGTAGGEDKATHTHHVDPDTGESLQYEDDGDGGERLDLSDSKTKAAVERKRLFHEGIQGIPLIGNKLDSAFTKIGGFLGGIKEKLFGDGESKKGILSSIWEAFTGKTQSIFSSIGQFLTGIPGSNLIKGLTNGMSLKSFLIDGASIAIVTALLSGKLDNFFHKLNPNAFGKGGKEADVVTTTDPETGEQKTATYDEEKEAYVDPDTGEVVTNVSVKKGGADSAQARSIKALGRQAVTGKKTWLGAFLKRNKLARNIGSTVKNSKLVANVANSSLGKGAKAFGGLTNMAKEMAESGTTKTAAAKAAKMMEKGGVAAQAKGAAHWEKLALKGEAKMLATQLDDACLGIGKALKKIPILKGLLKPDMVDDMCKSLSGTLQKAAAKLGPKIAKASAGIAKALPFLNIAFMVTDFTTGYEDARSTLGIVKEPTTGQKILSGILRLVKNLIPIVGPLIPDSIVVDVVANYIAPALGIDVSELTKAREEANETVAAYNAENGTDLSVTEYNKQVLGDYTWTERIGNAAKSVTTNIKQDFAAIKEKGIGQFAKDKVSGITNSFKEAFDEKGGGISGIISGIGAGFGQLLPGVLGEIAQKNMEIKALAAQGKIGEMWKISLSDFSQKDNPEAAMPSMFSKVIGQIPLIISKITATPFALFAKVCKPVMDFADNFVNKIKDGFGLLGEQIQQGIEITQDPNTDIKDVFDVSALDSQEDNPLGGIAKPVALAGRTAGFIFSLFKRFFKPIGEFFDGVKVSIQQDWDTFKSAKDLMADSNDPKETIAAALSGSLTYDSPLAALFRAGTVISGGFAIIKGAVKSVFGKIGDKIDEIKENIKQDYELFKGMVEQFKEAGGVKETVKLITQKVAYTGPLGGIFKTISMVNGVGYIFKNLFNGLLEDSPVAPIIKKLAEWFGAAKEKAGGILESAGNKVKNWISGGGSGNQQFVSQYDPRYAGQNFAGTNFADKGCGPAVAVMASNGRLSMSQAIAKSRRYQNGSGVSADYFADVLGGNVRYISGAGSTGGRVMNTLARGGKAILLGRDPYNNSKAYSPFGPNNHYVLATGLDRAGNLIINDPEGKGPRAYNPNILNSVGMSMLSGGASDMMGVPTDVAAKLNAREEFKNSQPKGKNDTEIARNVYGFLTGKGYSPGAAAGIMGNLFAESGMDPTRRQGGGGPAAGIAQWENANAQAGRWKDMANYAASKGKDWTDLESQLEFLVQELETKDMANRMAGTTAPSNLEKAGITGMSFDQFKQSDDINATTRVFEAAFERAGKPHMDARLAAAKEYYNWYSGSEWTGSFDPTVGSATGSTSSYGTSGSTGTSGSSSSGSSSSSSGGIGGILSVITDAFSKIGSIFSGSDKDNNSKSLTGTDDRQDSNASNASVTGGGDLTMSGSTVEGEMANNFPYYSQGDSRWGSKPYGSHGTLSSSACGPTSMAMVLKSYGTNVTPEDTANWSASHGYRGSNGTGWGFFNAIGQESGLTTQQFEDSGTAQQMLESNIPVIASMRPGHFTKGGHFIVLAGKNGDEILVNDPGKKARTHGWPADTVFSEAKQYWAISKDGKGSIGNIAGSNGNYEKGNYNLSNANTAALMAMQRAGVRTDYTSTAGANTAALMAQQSAAGSGIGNGSRWILNSNFSNKKSVSATNRIKYARRFSGGASDLDGSYDLLQGASDAIYNRAVNGTISNDQMNKGNEAIVALLKIIAQNTDFINEIYTFLKAVLSGGGSTNRKGDVPEAPKPKKVKGKTSGTAGNGEIDSSLRAAVMTLAAIARG